MLEVRDLRMVQAINEHGSLVRAARVLGIAQPALTRGLAALEARLRGPLFERGPQGTTATDLGRAVAAEATDILRQIARLDRHLGEVRGGQVRDLAIVAGAFVGESVGVVAAARMLAQYPAVRLRLDATSWTDVARAIHDREAPIGLMDLRGHRDDPGLELERLRPQPGIFVVRPEHPLTGRPELGLADIVAYPFTLIGHVPRAVHAPLVHARETARAAGAIHPAFPALVHESPTVALAALRHSDAVCAVTVSLALPALRGGALVALPWRAPWLSIEPVIVRLRNRPLDEAERAFLDLLRDTDAEFERDAIAWCADNNLSADCVQTDPQTPPCTTDVASRHAR